MATITHKGSEYQQTLVRWSRNPMPINGSAELFKTVIGTRPQIVLTFSDEFVTDDELTFDLTIDGVDYDFTMVASSSLQEDGNTLPEHDGFISLSEWIALALVAFQSHPILSDLFQIFEDSGQIIFLHPDRVASTLSVTSSNASGKFSVASSSSTAAVFSDPYKLKVHLYVDGASGNSQPVGQFRLIGEEYLSPDSQGDYELDIAPYYDSLMTRNRLDSGILAPQSNGVDQPAVCSARIAVSEVYGEPFIDHIKTFLPDFSVIHGGIYANDNTTDDNGFLGDAGIGYWENILTERSLTNMIGTIETSPNQPQILSFYRVAAGTVSIRVTAHYSEIADVNVTTGDITPSYDNYVAHVQASYYEFNWNTWNGTYTPIAYTVSLLNGATLLLSRRYDVIPRQRNERYIIFRNSLGGYDTLACTGVKKNMLDASSISAYDEEIGFHSFDHTIEETLTISTGVKSKSHFNALKDLFLCNFVELVTVDDPSLYETDAMRVRLDIIPDSIDWIEDEDYSYALVFRARFNKKERGTSAGVYIREALL